ncbi:hypothetical protein BDQ12DRAFT_707760 [Crucibulum laeve]|uniref:DUF6534 domain-containing protein n=1 Tax=Crucibulum laeve TaxID=68775 RepID=A0A5C3LTP1_9AGAR|nr:hypothetical protein BDQ12DRAFT_707760 [Crucibulum laeve]
MVDVPKTHGALLLGGLVATGLSGIVTVQSIVYFKLYPMDDSILKALVVLIWGLDLAHSGFICAAIWEYLISNYGNAPEIDFIPLSIALSIVFTAILTFFVHCFFAHRIFRLSQRNWYITCPIGVLALARLVSASVTSAEMIKLHSFILFKEHFRWVFSLGLALSCAVDIWVTLSLFILLQNSRNRSMRYCFLALFISTCCLLDTVYSSLNHIIDSLILYTFEMGSLTCAATIMSMICWLTMNDNLIFMGFHFVIGKLYANSLLATLNTRRGLRRAQTRSHNDIMDLDNLRRRGAFPFSNPSFNNTNSEIHFPHVQISVEKSVEYDVERI